MFANAEGKKKVILLSERRWNCRIRRRRESGEDGGRGRGGTEEGVFLDSFVGCRGSSWMGVSVGTLSWEVWGVLDCSFCREGWGGSDWSCGWKGSGLSYSLPFAVGVYVTGWFSWGLDIVGFSGRYGSDAWRFGHFEVISDSDVDILFIVVDRGTASIGRTKGFGGAKSFSGKLISSLYFPSGTGTWCGLEMAIWGNCRRFFLWMVLQACLVNSFVTLPNHWQASTGHFTGHYAVGWWTIR